MTLTKVFLTSLYGLVAVAGTMLAYGEEAFFPSGLSVLLAVFVLLVDERRDWLRMNALAGNLLGLAALGAAGMEYFGDRADAKLLAGAHFLVYVTWIVLMQTKEIRQYWWLSALSLLQVAVGSVLTRETGTYGLLLLVYLPLALWTLSVFTVYQSVYELGGLDHERPVRPELPAGASSAASGPGGLEKAHDSALALFRQQFSVARRSTVRHAIRQDSPGNWIGPRFVSGVAALAVAGLALGVVVFLFVPRVSFGAGVRFQSEQTRGRKLTGFSGEVQLGQIGQILENIDRVMRVRMFERVDGVHDNEISIFRFAEDNGLEQPLFRGSVLDQYRQGRWRGSQPDLLQSQMMPARPLERGMIRQEYVLELGGTEYLFAMRPISLARLYNPPGPINYAYDSGAFVGSVEGREPIEYLVYSRPRTAADRSAGRNEFGEIPGRRRLPAIARAFYLQLPEEGISGLIGRARELTAPEQLVGSGDLSPERRKAQTLERHLKDSGEYFYTLNLEVADPSRDPVEDFLLVRKRGHCEYFGSALALMLRAVDIPSRLVTGFKGAELHEESKYYEVQQRHAHVWVEAFVDNEWIVLDATPDERDEVVRQVAVNAGFWKTARNSISSLWSTYVVSLSLSRQQQALYDPLTGKVSTGWSSVRSGLGLVAAGVAWLKVVLTSPEQLFSPRGATIGLIAVAVALIVIRMGRRALNWTRRRLPAPRGRGGISRFFGWIVARLTGRPPDPARIVVEFYEQFLELVRAAGFTRQSDQTQREFARDIEGALRDRLAPAGLGEFPTQLAELFYRVRFGDAALQPAETTDLEQQLRRLAVSLNGKSALYR